MALVMAVDKTQQAEGLDALFDAAELADDIPALSENKETRRNDGRDVKELVAVAGSGAIVGYGQAAWHRPLDPAGGHWALEIVVAPDYRRGTVPEDLVTALVATVGSPDMTLWARTDYVVRAAERSGWARQRVLWEMHAGLPIDSGDHEVDGVRFAPFRIGVDENAWIDANNVTFAGHPENGEMTLGDLEERMGQTWFDPGGLILAWDGQQLAGSCWTKQHKNGAGEIYIIGVVPGREGRGLGRALVGLGLDYLTVEKQATVALLFVDSANERATGLYRRLGFETVRTVTAYSRPPNI